MSSFTDRDYHRLAHLNLSITKEIKKLANGDNKEVERINRSYQKIPDRNTHFYPEQLELLSWVLGDALGDKEPSPIEGLLSLAFAGGALCGSRLTLDDVDGARALIDDAQYNLNAAQAEIEKSLEKSRFASRPRTKKKPTNKILTMKSMRDWRNKNHTFDEFIEAAKNDSVAGFEIKAIAGDKFLLSWAMTNEEKKSKNTLLDWWTDSLKK